MKKYFIGIAILLMSFVLVDCLLFTSDFSNGSLTQGGALNNQQTGSQPWGAVINNGVVDFEVRITDPIVNGNHRSEIGSTYNNPLMVSAYWFNWTTKTPVGTVNDISPEGHGQFHDSTSSGSPLWEIVLINGSYWLWVARYPVWGGPATHAEYLLGSNINGHNNNWVMNYVPSLGSGGVMDLYWDGVLVKHLPGANANISSLGVVITANYFKTGMYKFGWSGGTPGTQTVRKVGVSLIQYGGSSCTIDDFITPTPSSNYIITTKKVGTF